MKNFLEMMKELCAILTASGGVCSKEEVQDYFHEMEMTTEQFDAVYQYLFENGITVRGFQGKVYAKAEDALTGDAWEEEETVKVTAEGKKGESRKRSGTQTDKKVAESMYGTLSDEQAEAMLGKMIQEGDRHSKEIFLQQIMPVLSAMAGGYKRKGLSEEELIQEGMLGLLETLNELEERQAEGPYLPHIKEGMQKGMERAIDSIVSEKDKENTMLAKLNLVHRAVEYLAEENSRLPTKEELATYTKIPLKEIEDILDLSKDLD